MNADPDPSNPDFADVRHLECIEREPFAPVGWLYTNVFEGLAMRGWAVRGLRGYEITAWGREVLDAHRSRDSTR